MSDAKEGKQEAALLTLDQIVAADDISFEVVDVPEWKGPVRLKLLSAAERDEFEALTMARMKGNKMDIKDMRAILVSMVMVDASGARLVSKDGIDALGKKSAKVLNRLFEKAQEMNAIGADAMKELEKN